MSRISRLPPILRYQNGQRWCTAGQHYVTASEAIIDKRGLPMCSEHKHRLRQYPRAKKYKLLLPSSPLNTAY